MKLLTQKSEVLKLLAQVLLLIGLIALMFFFYKQSVIAEVPDFRTPDLSGNQAETDYNWFSLPEFLPVIESVKR